MRERALIILSPQLLVSHSQLTTAIPIMTNEILWRYPEAEVLFDVADLGVRTSVASDPNFKWAYRIARCDGFADKRARAMLESIVHWYFDLYDI